MLIGAAASRRPQAAKVTVGDTPLELDLVLGGAAVIAGSVQEAEDGDPLPGALVVVTDERGEVIASGSAGEDGGFELAEIVPGTYTLAVSAARHRPAALPVEVAVGVPYRYEIGLERLHLAVGHEPSSR